MLPRGNLHAHGGRADAQFVALLENVPGGFLAGAWEIAPLTRTDILAVDIGPIATAQVADLDGWRVDVQHAWTRVGASSRMRHSWRARGSRSRAAAGRPSA